jgi:hypothetical protein
VPEMVPLLVGQIHTTYYNHAPHYLPFRQTLRFHKSSNGKGLGQVPTTYHVFNDLFTINRVCHSCRLPGVDVLYPGTQYLLPIAVTRQVIKTLKYEWLRCLPIINRFDHLTSLCTEFENWYNDWRPHMALDGYRLTRTRGAHLLFANRDLLCTSGSWAAALGKL